MNKRRTYHPEEQIKEKIVDSVLIVILIIATPLVGVSLLRYPITGWENVYTFQLFLYLTILLAVLFRKRINQIQKSYYLVFMLMLTYISGLYTFGYYAAAKYFIIPISILAGILINRKAGYVFLLLGVIYFMFIACIYLSNNLSYPFNSNEYVQKPVVWISLGLTLILISIGLMIVINKYQDVYTQLSFSLKSQEENYRIIFEQAADGILLSNLKGEILDVNKSFSEISGYTAEELIGKNIIIFFSEQELESQPLQYDKVLSGEVIFRIGKGLRKDGSEIEIEMQTRLLSDKRVQAFVRDVSEKKQFERTLYQASLSAEEMERSRLASELHDGLGPLLSTSKIYLHNLVNKDTKLKHDQNLIKLTSTIDDALTGIKEISNNISPHILRNFGLLQAVKSFVGRLENEITISVHGDELDNKRFEESVEISLYRIIIELINNSIKHAQAKVIKLEMKLKQRKLHLIYSDDGSGFEYSRIMGMNKGFGLYSIQSRISSLQGKVDFKSSPGEGMQVYIEVLI